jgi:hypothetical protein
VSTQRVLLSNIGEGIYGSDRFGKDGKITVTLEHDSQVKTFPVAVAIFRGLDINCFKTDPYTGTLYWCQLTDTELKRCDITSRYKYANFKGLNKYEVVRNSNISQLYNSLSYLSPTISLNRRQIISSSSLVSVSVSTSASHLAASPSPSPDAVNILIHTYPVKQSGYCNVDLNLDCVVLTAESDKYEAVISWGNPYGLLPGLFYPTLTVYHFLNEVFLHTFSNISVN